MSTALNKGMPVAPTRKFLGRFKKPAGEFQASRGALSHYEKARPGGKAVLAVYGVVLILITIINLFPVYWLFAGSVKTTAEARQYPPSIVPETFSLESYNEAWNGLDYVTYFGNSVILTFGGVALQILASVMAAYALSKMNLKGAKVLLFVIMAAMMIPSITYFVPQYLTVSNIPLLNISLINTWWAVWLPGVGAPITVLLLKQFFDQIPNELLESAMIDGAASWRILWKIILPLSRPVLAVVTVYAITASWKQFLWPLLVLPNQNLWPLEVALYKLRNTDVASNVQYAALTIATLPMIALFLMFQKQILKGMAFTGSKG